MNWEKAKSVFGISNLHEKEDISPMERIFNEFDQKHSEWYDTEFKPFAMNVPIDLMSELLLEEIKWKKEHRQNMVISCHGKQRSGKTNGMSYLGWLLGTIYGVPFTVKDIYFSPHELDDALSKAKYGETLLRDEHRYRNVGLMSHVVSSSLADYEDQLGHNMNNLLFCAVELQDHSHSYIFETQQIVWGKRDGKPYPEYFIFMLKTRNFLNSEKFVWRGRVSFRMPSDDFVKEYMALKDQHILNLKQKYGDNLDFVGYDIKEMMESNEKLFVTKDQHGFWKPQSAALIESILMDTFHKAYTKDVTKIVIARIKDYVVKKYETQNTEMQKAFLEIKLLKDKEKLELLERHQKEVAERQEKKIALQEKFFSEQKRMNDIKERAMKLKEETTKAITDAIKQKKGIL